MKPIKLANDVMPGGSIMIYGANNTGKTVLTGAALKYFAEHGHRISFLSWSEEKGHDSLVGIGIDEQTLGYPTVFEVSTLDEYLEWLTYVEKEKIDAVGIDSLWAMYRAVQAKFTGGERPPSGGTGANNEWTLVHYEMHNQMTRLRKTVKWVIVTCLADLGADMIKTTETGVIESKPRLIVPDLSGKMSTGCVHWFNMVGYLSISVVKTPKVVVKRTLSFSPNTRFVTRVRLPFGTTVSDLDIPIPDNDPVKGWATLMDRLNHAYKLTTHQPQPTKEVTR